MSILKRVYDVGNETGKNAQLNEGEYESTQNGCKYKGVNSIHIGVCPVSDAYCKALKFSIPFN